MVESTSLCPENRAQGAGQAQVLLGEADGGAKPGAVFQSVIVGAGPQGDAKAAEQELAQIPGRFWQAEEQVIGCGRKNLGAAQGGQTPGEIVAAGGVLPTAPLRKTGAVRQGRDGCGKGKGVEVPDGDFGAQGSDQFRGSGQIADTQTTDRKSVV